MGTVGSTGRGVALGYTPCDSPTGSAACSVRRHRGLDCHSLATVHTGSTERRYFTLIETLGGSMET